jgi:hypothetical protein
VNNRFALMHLNHQYLLARLWIILALGLPLFVQAGTADGIPDERLKGLFRSCEGQSFDLRKLWDWYESYQFGQRPPPADWYRIQGKVLSVSTEGILVSAKDLGDEPLFLKNYPRESALVDGSSIKTLAMLVGRYSYSSAGGAAKTVRMFDYGKVDEAGWLQARRNAERKQAELAAKLEEARILQQRVKEQKLIEADKKALEFQKQQAARGNANAQYDLGLRYLEGRGLAKDTDEGTKLLRAAAKGGSTLAEKKLSELGIAK